jgi:5-methyltetrahydrofolate--homocysteine methyltransferase
MALTESLAMTPAASVSGFYLAHPQSSYFNVGRIGEDQMKAWAESVGVDEQAARRRLGASFEGGPATQA